MPQCIILPSAEDDLDNIWDFIAQDSLQNADRFVDGIYDFCRETLAAHPSAEGRKYLMKRFELACETP